MVAPTIIDQIPVIPTIQGTIVNGIKNNAYRTIKLAEPFDLLEYNGSKLNPPLL